LERMAPRLMRSDPVDPPRLAVEVTPGSRLPLSGCGCAYTAERLRKRNATINVNSFIVDILDVPTLEFFGNHSLL